MKSLNDTAITLFFGLYYKHLMNVNVASIVLVSDTLIKSVTLEASIKKL